jgi:hypothetical protein
MPNLREHYREAEYNVSELSLTVLKQIMLEAWNAVQTPLLRVFITLVGRDIKQLLSQIEGLLDTILQASYSISLNLGGHNPEIL